MESLNQRIAGFYDASSGLWESAWGAHMHHGHYGPAGDETKDHRRAQVDMIEALLDWGDVDRPQRILDVGCGIGGSTLWLAERFGAEAVGLTLSPVQARRAADRAASSGHEDRVRFVVADALYPPLPPASFDLVWSLESGEHMPDKPRFLRACAELLAPGGRFVMATWCHRPRPPGLAPAETRLLDRLYRAYHLPYITSIDALAEDAARAGFAEIAVDDWTEAVAPFWPAVVRSAFRPGNLLGLVRAGREAIGGALAMRLMIRGYRTGLIRFGVLRGVRR